MKKQLLLSVFFLYSLGQAFAQTSPASTSQASPEQQAILQLEQEIATAYNTGNTKVLERALAEDVIAGDGLTKQLLINYKKPYDADNFELSRVRARVWDNTAVAYGTMTVSSNQQNKKTYIRFTDTFIKRQNNWQMVASRHTEVPVWVARRMEDKELTPLVATDCSQESSLRSLDETTPAFIEFKNATSQPIIRQWINREGKRDTHEAQKVTIPPGGSTPVQTYVSHPFVISDASGKCLGIYVAKKEPGLVVVQ